jgi:hypothetical protein
LIRKISLTLGLLSISGYAMAEGGHCPPGYYPISSPGVIGCAPIPGYGGDSQSPQPSSLEWQARWGAIVADGKKGSLGIASGMKSRHEAENVATVDCRAKGGDDCQVELVYNNQCGVMIVGDRGYNTASAATAGEATQIGMKTCAASDTNCRVYYSDCSYAAQAE